MHSQAKMMVTMMVEVNLRLPRSLHGGYRNAVFVMVK
jgi:hypothetical protein